MKQKNYNTCWSYFISSIINYLQLYFFTHWFKNKDVWIFKKVSFYFLFSFICIATVLCFEVSIKLLKKNVSSLQYSIFKLLDSFGSIAVYNSTLISFEEEKMYLETIPFYVLTVPVLSAQFFALDNPCLEKFRLCSTSCRVSYMTGSLNCQFCVCDDPRYSSNSSLFLILYFMEFTFYAICF